MNSKALKIDVASEMTSATLHSRLQQLKVGAGSGVDQDDSLFGINPSPKSKIWARSGETDYTDLYFAKSSGKVPKFEFKKIARFSSPISD